MLSAQVQAMSPRPPFPPGMQGMTPGMAQTMAAALQHQHQHQQQQHGQHGPVSAHQPGGHMPPPFPFSAAAMAHMIAGARGTALPAPRPQPAHQHPAPMLPPGPMAMPALVPLPSPFPPGMLPGDPRAMGPPLGFPTFVFTQEDLDMVLYGYARGKPGSPGASQGHALSGLRIGELSYGIERILGSHAPVKSSHGPVDPSSLDLPEGLELAQTTFAGTVHYGIFCKKTVISKGSKLGPFRGKQVNTSEIKTNDDNSFMWEIFLDNRLSHFVDGRGNTGNWMAFVNCARYAQEQNLIALQVDGEIWYEACKDIPQGAELLVWYGDQYLQFMGIPVALKDSHDGLHEEELESALIDSEGYKCERCGKVFAYKYYRDKHLKYTRCVDQGDRKFPCHLCTRSFEKRDRLRIHILHVHEKHRPHKCRVCGKSFSQSSSLNKHMRVHSGERPYKCVYCSKAFTASSILRTHIRQHSGEKPFKCKHCGKAFASHAAHDSHVRRTHTKDRPVIACDVCGKTFTTPGDLKLHAAMHHGVPGGSMNTGNFSIQRLASSESDESLGMDMNSNMSSPRPQSYPHPLAGHFGKFHDEAIDVVGIGNDGMHRVAS